MREKGNPTAEKQENEVFMKTTVQRLLNIEIIQFILILCSFYLECSITYACIEM